MVNCENCKFCVFDDRHGVNLNRYYCSHKENPGRVQARSAYTLICTTARHSKEFSIKRTPVWCPKEKKE